MPQPFRFASHLLPLRPGASREERIERNRQMLLRALSLKTTVAFIGSGVSLPFEYPGWIDFALDTFKFADEKLRKPSSRQALEALRPDPAQNLEPNSLLFLLGACRNLIDEDEDVKRQYCDHLKSLFAPKGKRPLVDPFGPLLDLPIRRFATSNYDCEIEIALSRRREISLAEFGLADDLSSLSPAPGTCGRSFTQRRESLHQIARFALTGVAGNEDQVFHCHGRFDDPRSMIVTEGDYQDWYLGSDGASLAYQQTIRMVLGTNPVLFVGYGVREEDLLRPLRQLVESEPERKGARPVFALFAEPKGREDEYHQDGLFERFGVHVVPYESRGTTTEERTRALYDALVDLGRDLRQARKEWLRKPRLRRAKAPSEKPELHRDIRLDLINLEVIPLAPLSEPKASVESPPVPSRSILRPGIVILTGPSGAGKSAHALKLLEIGCLGGEGVEKYDGGFYWNAHYANETVTAIDYALSYFDPKGFYSGTPESRMVQCLLRHRHLLIVDGCERLLSSGSAPGSARAYSPNFRRLLRAFANREIQSTVILAGRVRPADLDDLQIEREGAPLLRSVEARRIKAGDLCAVPPFKGLRHQDVSALCSLLRGHHYGLALAFHHLVGSKAPKRKLRRLNERLAGRLPEQRLREILLTVLDDLDRDVLLKHGQPKAKGIARAFLERLGLFLDPVCKSTVLSCFESAWREVSTASDACRPGLPRRERERIVEDLHDKAIKRGLLLPMGLQRGPSECEIEGYTLHATVRRLLLLPEKGQVADPLPAVGLAGFTSGRLGVAPDHSRCRQIHELFDKLVSKAAKSFSSGKQPSRRDRQLCRDAFGLVRTRMEVNTAPRWTNYEDYLRFGAQLIQLARQVTPRHWTFCEHWDARTCAEHRKAPLYAAELAWLYNDTALAMSSEGHVHDACALWDQAYEVSRLLEDPTEGGGFHLEVLLNLTFNFMEMGRLPAAQGYLNKVEQLLQGDRDDDYVGRIQGLRGLMEHFRGNLQAACDLYDEALGRLRRRDNLRAQSIYLKHRADVKIAMGECDEASLLIRSSRSLAEAGVFPELAAHARISEGHRFFRLKEAVKARMEYDAVLREARRLKARKLEVRALTALARLALDQKDKRAHEYAIQSLSLANELGLGLRQTHSLVVLGLVTLEDGQRDLGVAYLRHAKRLADKQEYWARSREAENKLLELDIDPNGAEYPPRSVTGMRK